GVAGHPLALCSAQRERAIKWMPGRANGHALCRSSTSLEPCMHDGAERRPNRSNSDYRNAGGVDGVTTQNIDVIERMQSVITESLRRRHSHTLRQVSVSKRFYNLQRKFRAGLVH